MIKVYINSLDEKVVAGVSAPRPSTKRGASDAPPIRVVKNG